MPTRILIADDNSSVRTALRQLMDDQHCEFLEAADGREAVSKTLEFQPNVVILDLAMPVMDGLSAARQILKAIPATPIFLCTMHWSPHLEREAKSLGVLGVISKARSSILVDAVAQLLNTQQTDSSDGALPIVSTPGVTMGPTLVGSPLAPDRPVKPAGDPQNAPQIRRSG